MSRSPFTRRSFLAAVSAAGATALGGTDIVRSTAAWAAIPGPTTYSPIWSSVDQHPPAPEWFQDAKFGIYYHWGVFSVPAYGNEWYPRNMYNNGSNENNHHKAVYGDPSVWPYHDFINGARDKAGNWVQFAPRLSSTGGAFNPDAWAQLFVDAGAKFAGPVAEHHDGFSMWNSSVNEWNSVAKGPRLDLLRLHADAIADSAGNTANGALAIETSATGGNNQQWRLNDMGNGRYQIINRGTGTALDSGGVNTVGAPVKLWTPDSSSNLQWTITAV